MPSFLLSSTSTFYVCQQWWVSLAYVQVCQGTCFSPPVIFLLTVLKGDGSFVDPFCYLCFIFILIMLSCLLLAALWSPAGKGLTSWLSCMLCFCVFFVTFPYGVPGQIWYLNVSIPDFKPFSLLVFIFAIYIFNWWAYKISLISIYQLH